MAFPLPTMGLWLTDCGYSFINKANPVVPKIQEIKAESASDKYGSHSLEQLEHNKQKGSPSKEIGERFLEQLEQKKKEIDTPPTTPEKANNAAAATVTAAKGGSIPLSEKAANGQIELPPTPPQVTAQ